MTIGKFELKVTGRGSAYLRLPTHPGVLRGARTVTLSDVLGAYKGPYVVFDFDSAGVLVGIETILEDDDDDEESAGGGPGSEEAEVETDGEVGTRATSDDEER